MDSTLEIRKKKNLVKKLVQQFYVEGFGSSFGPFDKLTSACQISQSYDVALNCHENFLKSLYGP